MRRPALTDYLVANLILNMQGSKQTNGSIAKCIFTLACCRKLKVAFCFGGGGVSTVWFVSCLQAIGNSHCQISYCVFVFPFAVPAVLKIDKLGKV